MTDGVGIWRCAHCGAAFFPRRLLCLSCHKPEMVEDRVHQGRVEEIATIRHMIGRQDWKPRRIANVATEAGISITVGLTDDAAIGDTVVLSQQGTAPFGRKA